MSSRYSSQSMVAGLKSVVVKSPTAAYVNEAQVSDQWRPLDYLGMPDFEKAVHEHRCFVDHLEACGAEVIYLPRDDLTGLDSLYTHDPVASVTNEGAILGRMGKSARLSEPNAMANLFAQLDIPILGSIETPGMMEGGDVVWLDSKTVAIGVTYRTNSDGIRQFRELVAPAGVDVVEVPMVHWDGPAAVLHLMSIISMLDDDLAIVYEKLLPIAFRKRLLDKQIDLLPMPEHEYDSLGCNVLAVGPRQCLIRSGNDECVKMMEEAGCTVNTFEGDEICCKGSGGPTCLTRPIWRE